MSATALPALAIAAGSGPASPATDALVWGYRFTEAGQAEPLNGAAARAALEKQESWLWLHFDLGDPGAAAAIASLPHLVISARRLPGHTLHQVSLGLQSGRRFPDVLRLFDAIIHAFTSATSFLTYDLANKLDEMEECLLDHRKIPHGPQVLGRVRRALVRLHRQAVPLRAVLIHMLTERPAFAQP